MGNRAVITDKEQSFGIYLHWNGGPESVAAFLKVCELRGYRSPGSDNTYAFARLIGVIHEFFGGGQEGDDGLSLGCGDVRNLDTHNMDNGVYTIGDNWKIVKWERWDDSAGKYFPMSGATEEAGFTEMNRKRYLGIVCELMRKLVREPEPESEPVSIP